MSVVSGRCIFYRTLTVDPSSSRGSDLRPAKLLQAFRDLGYDVDVVDGPVAVRKQAADRVMRRIQSGARYQFVYAEPPTTPLALNEPHHLPIHPFMDYRFLAFCHAQGVPVILFYCDVQWRLPQYSAQVGRTKYLAALPFFHLDLSIYRRIVDVLLVPNEGMLRLMPKWAGEKRHAVSIPGFDPLERSLPRDDRPGSVLRLFYVGGVQPPVYDLLRLLRGSARASEAGVKHELTICTRESEWRRRPVSYNQYLGPHVVVVHNRTREELLEFYSRHDIAVMPYGTLNSDWAMPVKFPEAIGMGLPVLAGAGTAVGSMVTEQGIGWVVGAGEDDLAGVLRGIDAQELVRARRAVETVQPAYTWTERAREIVDAVDRLAANRSAPLSSAG